VEGATDNKPCEKWDRLILLLIVQPRAGWESQFEELIGREVERLAVRSVGEGCDE
jgi:hypothetical protein